jgi:hypothetical protein
MMRSIGALALAATLAIPLAVPATAQPRDYHDNPGRHDDRAWHDNRDRHDNRDHAHDGGNGAAVLGGALLGLGIGAVVGSALAPPPPVYYAPPPRAYYAPPPPVYDSY